jgi:hypothetical protein
VIGPGSAAAIFAMDAVIIVAVVAVPCVALGLLMGWLYFG